MDKDKGVFMTAREVNMEIEMLKTVFDIVRLVDEKTALAAQLDEIRKAEKKAKEAAELKRLLKLMHKKDISVEDLEAMISREA